MNDTVLPECPMPEGCGYTSHMTYEIRDPNGVVLDKTSWDNLVAGSFWDAVKHKYALFAHIFEWREEEAQSGLQKKILRTLNI